MGRHLSALMLSVAVLLAGCDAPREAAAPVPVAPLAEGVAPAPVRMDDIERGRTMAAVQCADCHGIDGVLARSGAPYIAGLEQEYLVRSILAYGNGSRRHGEMMKVAQALSALDLRDLTAYYASLATPWQGAVAGAKSRAVIHDRPAHSAAQHIITGCKSCHAPGEGHKKNQRIPNLDGMPLEYFEPAFKSYFDGRRHNEIMILFQGKLNDRDIYNLGAYYASKMPQRAEPPQSGNAANGKIAARACAGCHGYDGNSLNPHIPNLAGQPGNYLISAIKDYRDGRRKELLMEGVLHGLKDGTVADLAAYYSRQQPRSQLHKDLESPQAFNPLAEGEVLAAMCDSCHGPAGNSRTPGTPSLTGLSVRYLTAATQAYQFGRRSHGKMAEVVSFYSDTDIEKIAYYYATRSPRPAATPAVGDVAIGEGLSQACSSCHGEGGVSGDPNKVPSLAGQEGRYLIEATRAYAHGGRSHEGMRDVAIKLDEESLRHLAAYFASRTPVAVQTYLPDNPTMLVEQRCSRCHGERGYSTQPGVPRLAGQLESYLVLALKEYQEGGRKDSAMHAMSDVLSLLEIKAIAAYYAKQ